MEYEVRLVVRPRSPDEIEIVLGELDQIGEVVDVNVTVDVRLMMEADTTEDASNRALRLVERAVTYADDVWLAGARESRGESGEAG